MFLTFVVKVEIWQEPPSDSERDIQAQKICLSKIANRVGPKTWMMINYLNRKRNETNDTMR